MNSRPDLTTAHLRALDRRRRIVMHEDANMPIETIGMDLAAWMAFRFDHVDLPESMIDAIWWDIGLAEDTYALYDSRILPKLDHPDFRKWWDAGIDWVGELVRETKARGLECFWSHRVCPVDFPRPWVSDPIPHDHPARGNPLKKAHPEWVNACWWPFGLWNLAHPEVQRRKVAILKEIATLYEIDGFQLDFARHTPCLPLGQEWKHRDALTEFIRTVRTMLLSMERQTGRPLLLAVRVPEDEAACRADGFDIQTWAQEDLVDIYTPGGRTTTLGLDWYRRLMAGSPAKLCCSFDGHHTTDGYYQPDVPYYRGVFSGFWNRGADSVAVFNWPCAKPELYDTLGLPEMMKCQAQTEALLEIGDPAAMAAKPAVFALERRGGYPWAGNAFYRNDNLPLPRSLPDDGTPLALPLPVYSPAHVAETQQQSACLRLILRGKLSPEALHTTLNGSPLTPIDWDESWQDGQIYGDGPQPTAGAWKSYLRKRRQALLRLDLSVPTTLVREGLNQVELRLIAGTDCPVHVEKVELHVGPTS